MVIALVQHMHRAEEQALPVSIQRPLDGTGDRRQIEISLLTANNFAQGRQTVDIAPSRIDQLAVNHDDLAGDCLFMPLTLAVQAK